MSSKPPTTKQLAYLRALAERTGQTFVTPRTSRDASAEIRRLKATPAESRLERRIERNLIADSVAVGRHDSVRVTDSEVTGYGSSASWSPPVMTTPTVTETFRNGNDIGKRTELGRYRTVTGVERVLYGQRVATVVRITDVPAERPGRAYLVERGLEQDGNAPLIAVVQDHLEQANRLGVPPMSTTVVG